jgi:hypothetical protein
VTEDIVLNGYYEKRTVKAEIVGPFGVHRSGWLPARGFVITHIATGLRVGTYYFRARKDALLVAQRLARSRAVKWNVKKMIPKRACPPYRRVVERALRGVQWKDGLGL